MNQVHLIILGSILALITSFFLESYKAWKDDKKSAINLKIILRLELKNTIQIIDRLMERYGSINFYDVKILNQLGSSTLRLEQTRERVIHLKEDSKKEEVLSCINVLSIFHSDLFSVESQAFDKEKLQDAPAIWNDEYYKKQRNMLMIKSVDIKRRVQDILNYLEK